MLLFLTSLKTEVIGKFNKWCSKLEHSYTTVTRMERYITKEQIEQLIRMYFAMADAEIEWDDAYYESFMGATVRDKNAAQNKEP